MKKNSKKGSLGLIAAIAVIAFLVLISLALLMSFIIGQPQDLVLTGFGEKIAVIPVKGVIMMEEPGPFEGELSADEIVASLDEAEADFGVGAVILEINSGGGSVVASRYIAQRVRAMDKPVVAFISEAGASAAYHVASSADVIVADPDSLTGSIGVVSAIPNLSQLLQDWGVEMEVVKSGQFKDMGSMFKDLTPEERAILQTILDEAFLRFKSEIKAFRQGRLNEPAFEAVADGRLLSGSQAFDVGLVDQLGTKQDAIETAMELGEIETPVIEEYGVKEIGLLDLLASSGQSFGQGFVSGLSSQPKTSVQS